MRFRWKAMLTGAALGTAATNILRLISSERPDEVSSANELTSPDLSPAPSATPVVRFEYPAMSSSLPTNSSAFASVEDFRTAVSRLTAEQAVTALQQMITRSAQLQPKTLHQQVSDAYLITKQDMMNFMFAMPFVSRSDFVAIIQHIIAVDNVELLTEMMADRPASSTPYYRIPVIQAGKKYRPQIHPDETIFKPLSLFLQSVRSGGARIVNELFNIILHSQPKEFLVKNGDMLQSKDSKGQAALFQAAFRQSDTEFQAMFTTLMNLTHQRAQLYAGIKFQNGRILISVGDGSEDQNWVSEGWLRRQYHATKQPELAVKLDALVTCQKIVNAIKSDKDKQITINKMVARLNNLARWYLTQKNIYGVTVRDYLVATYGDTHPRVKLLDEYASRVDLSIIECQGNGVAAYAIDMFARASRLSTYSLNAATDCYGKLHQWLADQGIVAVIEGTPAWFRQHGFDITTPAIAAILAGGVDKYYDIQIAKIKKTLIILQHIISQHHEPALNTSDLKFELVSPSLINVIPAINWSAIVFKWFPNVTGKEQQQAECIRFQAKWAEWFLGEITVAEEGSSFYLVFKPTKQPKLMQIGDDGETRTLAEAVVYSRQQAEKVASALNKNARVSFTGVDWAPHLDKEHSVACSQCCFVTTRAITEAEADAYLDSIKPEYREWFSKKDTGNSHTSYRWKIQCDIPDDVTIEQLTHASLLVETAKPVIASRSATSGLFSSTPILSPAKLKALEEAEAIRQLQDEIRQDVAMLGREAAEVVLNNYHVEFDDELRFPQRLKDPNSPGKQPKYFVNKADIIAGLESLRDDLRAQRGQAAVAAPAVGAGQG